MRSYVLLVVGAALLASACNSLERTTASATPAFASVGNVPDLDGLPDLTVDAKKLAHSWLIRDEDMSQCSVVEGGVSPGTHSVLRFTATTPNIGTADVFVGDPLAHVAANDGMFEYALCHDHYHFRHYATYELISVATGAVVQAAKVSRSAYKLYRKSPSVTEYKVFPDRGHSLTVDSGWKEVANASLTWLKSKGL